MGKGVINNSHAVTAPKVLDVDLLGASCTSIDSSAVLGESKDEVWAGQLRQCWSPPYQRFSQASWRSWSASHEDRKPRDPGTDVWPGWGHSRCAIGQRRGIQGNWTPYVDMSWSIQVVRLDEDKGTASTQGRQHNNVNRICAMVVNIQPLNFIKRHIILYVK